MVPIAMGIGADVEFRSPMAIAVIGGIVVSTVLSLVVVPSFFLIMDDLQRLLARIFRGMVGRKEAEPVVPEAAELAASVAETRDDLAALEARLNRVEGQRRDGPPGRLEAAE